MVEDHPLADIAGGRNASLWAVWKRDPVWQPPVETDAVIDDLGELPGVIRRLATTLPA